MPNHLVNEKSPYLLQHAHNPVDWFPWGEEAFAKARRENKPILLSIGYSTCHWCHVMEHESFSNPEIAQVMNENVVAIKLDREERPDIDKIYMTSVQVMTGQGGWPLNVFLTPDLKPFYGGTYFPPEERWGRIGWPELVKKVGDAWKNPEEQKKILASAGNLTNQVTQFLAGQSQVGDINFSIAEQGFKNFQADYDSVLGGFGGAPKFPMPVNHHFLLRYAYAVRDKNPKESKEALEMSLTTLQAMAQGGIYDQLGGGFARYSTDERWHVPHFEKMLYDNAQLIVNYLEAFQMSGEALFADVARESLDYILRDMTHPKGGFYSAEDADSLSPKSDKKVEGAFYVWEKKEILNALGTEYGEIFSFYYGVLEHGNAASDPQGEFDGKNILYAAKSLEETAAHFEKSTDVIKKILSASKEMLFMKRTQRPRPHLDDKLITAWNGLAISAFAKAGTILGDKKYLAAAEASARFMASELFDSGTGQLYRRWRDGEKKIAGMADDYAFAAQGFLDLYETNFDQEWLNLSRRLMEQLNHRFFDLEHPGLFMTEKGTDSDLILRARDDHDNVEPSAVSVAVRTALKLSHVLGDAVWEKWGERILKNFAQSMKKNPRAHPQMMSALLFALSPHVCKGGVCNLPSEDLGAFKNLL